mgnify:FL=1
MLKRKPRILVRGGCHYTPQRAVLYYFVDYAITKIVHTNLLGGVAMKETDVIQILREELTKHKNPVEALAETRIRISLEVALYAVKPIVSAERWDLFLRLVQSEPEWLKIVQFDKGQTLIVNSNKMANAYMAIVKAFEFLLHEYPSTPERFQMAWTQDQLVDLM